MPQPQEAGAARPQSAARQQSHQLPPGQAGRPLGVQEQPKAAPRFTGGGVLGGVGGGSGAGRAPATGPATSQGGACKELDPATLAARVSV
eukprot:1688635-Rhodomonas_salina.1